MDAGNPLVWAVERWEVKQDGRVCAGCRFMANRLFLVGEGPRPPLHDGCRCWRATVDLSGLTGEALIALAATVARNGARGEDLVLEARQRRGREQNRLHGVGREWWAARRRAVRLRRLRQAAGKGADA